jgi:pimeloyl-ACP methyl ester carboxylesterase
MKSGTVDIGEGVHLYYEEAGKGDVLLFVHGMWATTRWFRKQLEDLQSDFRVIAVDLRGHGGSTMTTYGQTVPTYARDLQTFIQKMKLDEFIGIGWSMGSFVWWEHYLQFGVGGLRGLIDIDQPPSDWQSAEIPDGLLNLQSLRSWHEAILTDYHPLMRRVLPLMFASPPTPEDLDWMVEEACRAPAVLCAAELIDQSLREYQGMLKGYPVPMLVCSGAQSPEPRAALQMIVDRVDKGRLEVFENCGHALFLEDTPKFNRCVREFAREVLSSRA